jgi:hypothetical protein
MSAAVSASRTCSGPDLMSTTRSRASAVAPELGGGTVIGRRGSSTIALSITPVAPHGFWGDPGIASPSTSILFALVEPASDHARRSFRAGSRFAAARHGVEFKPVANEFVTELIGNDFL